MSGPRSTPNGRLPVDSVLPEIRSSLSAGDSVVFQAAPGAGKTTRIPLALYRESWMAGQKILLQEPRRLAARACAAFSASLLGEKVGQTVGYRMRSETVVGPSTRIEVVTEGVLIRILQEDPGLEGVGLVILDEFHERTLSGDLALAFLLDVQHHLRPDLRLLIMSATLPEDRLRSLLPHWRWISTPDTTFPVEVRHLPLPRIRGLVDRTLSAVETALQEESGSVLVFLPGEKEIHSLHRHLQQKLSGNHILLAPLYGRLPLVEQQTAMMPAPEGKRKIVMSTPVAETGLTIEGIRIVVDSGRRRISRLDARTGLNHLETIRISQASARQRCGRAGRLEPGTCYRIWSEYEHATLLPFSSPEMLYSDLTALSLELALWGAGDPSDLVWLDPPPAEEIQRARHLLYSLDALDGDGRVTGHGRRMARFGVHPRLAHMMVRAAEAGHGATACLLAALLSERETRMISPGTAEEVDIRWCLDGNDLIPGGTEGIRKTKGRVTLATYRLAERWRRMLGIREEKICVENAGKSLALAYPERIGQRRPGSKTEYLLSSGRGAFLPAIGTLSAHEYLVIADLEGGSTVARIFLAAPYDAEDLWKQFHSRMETVREVFWDSRSGSLIARKKILYGKWIWQQTVLEDVRADEVRSANSMGLRQEGWDGLLIAPSAVEWLSRVRFLAHLPGQEGNWPDLSEENLLSRLDQWLGPYLEEVRKRSDLQRLSWQAIFEGMLDEKQRRRLREWAPTHFVAPTGSRVPLRYQTDGPPILAIRIQELFGLTETPRVAGNLVPVRLHLLSPSGRPAQVTQDLAGFWSSSYKEVRKELAGRYPRHPWPEDPRNAVATRRPKPKAGR